ncbi:endonuclease-reverse transcriptase [Elysia marginata]|uniref:Endonuclease-reverse transcriptase n=1 Tax=Elysia marginata TaxID=1093978 RepID=A0AAV4FAT2_9GAST|nr:endonuclease-reverse transcriptase [Elysia marginata]
MCSHRTGYVIGQIEASLQYIKDAHQDLPTENDSPPIQRPELEAAVKSLKLGKAPGVDNIPSELLKAGGEEVNNIPTALCQRIWNEKKWPTEWTKSLMVPLPKKGNLRLCNNYRTISLISHPSKVMLRVILSRLKPKAEEILAEEQAGFRAGRSTVEQIFNCRILIEKHMQHQRDLFHNFIDFKKAFDMVWHDGLWHVLRGLNIDEGLVKTIESLYMNSN